MPDISPVNILIGMFVFMFSATCHEAAHAWAALRGGDATAYEGGQVSLDPFPHIQRAPFGMVLAPILSMIFMGFPMGWAATPYNPYWAGQYPKRHAWMSLAGPLANLVLMVIALVIYRAMDDVFLNAYRSQMATGDNSPWVPVEILIRQMYILNIILFLFNLIPLPPLDGSGAILLFVPEEKAHKVTATLEGIGPMGLPLAWIIFSGFLRETGLIRWMLIFLGF
ncbi:MAG: site-2 protease family protein [Acidobacteriota bacterium]|nr:site-2 protease family protein [Acidobacteriota bacterium]